MQTGVWQRVHEAVLGRFGEHDQIAWDAVSVDTASMPSSAGGEYTGRDPTDRGKLGCRDCLRADQGGLLPVAQMSSAPVNDSQLSKPFVESTLVVNGCWAALANIELSWMLIECMLLDHIGSGSAGV